MPKLNDFKDMVNEVDDIDLLSEGQGLLRDIIEIEKLKYRMVELEDGLIKNGRAAFYLFAMELDEDEIVYAAERISGRIKVLERKKEKEKKEKEKKEKEEKEEKEKDEENTNEDE